MVIVIGAGGQKLSVVLANDLVNWPVHLLTCRRAVVDRLVTTTETRTDVVVHSAESLSLSVLHAGRQCTTFAKRERDL